MSKILLTLLLAVQSVEVLSAQVIEGKFSTEKTNYLVGEPLFANLTLSNKGGKPVWLDFKSPDMPMLCHDFAVDVGGAESAHDWSCGYAGSCGHSFREVAAGGSIILGMLVNGEFHLRRTGKYSIHARTTVIVHEHDTFDSPQVAQMDLSDVLEVELRSGSEKQMAAAFQLYVRELESSDERKRSEAAGAIMELGPPFLEEVLIKLAKTTYGYGAVNALRRIDTPKSREALAQIAMSDGDLNLRAQAIRNLGRMGDANYLPLLSKLTESSGRDIQIASADAAGELGGAKAIQQLKALTASGSVDARVAGASGLGGTHTRESVAILVALLLDPEPNVRMRANGSLYLLTHRGAFDGNGWADVAAPESAAVVHERWAAWWSMNSNSSKIYSPRQCGSPEPLP